MVMHCDFAEFNTLLLILPSDLWQYLAIQLVRQQFVWGR